MSKKRTIYYILLVVVVASLTIANINVPICSRSATEESTNHFLSIAVIFIFVLPLMAYMATKKEEEAKKYIPFFFLVFFTSAPSFWSTMNRAQKFEREYWDFEGVVEAKYISSNHEAKSMTINGVSYESIPSNLWNMIKEGDSLSKRSCSGTILINGIKKTYNEDLNPIQQNDV